MTDANNPIHQGSGNVFADLGFDKEEAANLLVRARLMSRLIDYIEAEGLTQEKAALRLAFTSPAYPCSCGARSKPFLSMPWLPCLRRSVWKS